MFLSSVRSQASRKIEEEFFYATQAYERGREFKALDLQSLTYLALFLGLFRLIMEPHKNAPMIDTLVIILRLQSDVLKTHTITDLIHVPISTLLGRSLTSLSKHRTSQILT